MAEFNIFWHLKQYFFFSFLSTSWLYWKPLFISLYILRVLSLTISTQAFLRTLNLSPPYMWTTPNFSSLPQISLLS